MSSASRYEKGKKRMLATNMRSVLDLRLPSRSEDRSAFVRPTLIGYMRDAFAIRHPASRRVPKAIPRFFDFIDRPLVHRRPSALHKRTRRAGSEEKDDDEAKEARRDADAE